ncbi:MAG: tRNA 5-methoxyuridine(34)/uridine 5-oxyacetic acid(34) synthase CmoB [Chromatiaceae bacterium]|nr:tRNA 5-methoxyuridine(34)/uridine 5-oxyacetic acid(34) synthase CmoB [Chromatiaceae bacterium]
MIDPAQVRQLLSAEGLEGWAAGIEAQLAQVLRIAPHGDWGRWQQALDDLPALGGGRVHCDDGALNIVPEQALSAETRERLRRSLMALHPWRKGPYRVADIMIDTEWRSDWKWQRVLPHIAPLHDRLVLDVGCGNGYHCWRIAEAGARRVIGVDPTALFIAQHLAIRQLLSPMAPDLAQRVQLLPLGIEDLPAGLGAFDTLFSMGVLYHRRSPIDHLMDLRAALRPGGQLVLETLVIEGGPDQVLVPNGRYAKMRNVWFIPSAAMLETWLRRSGFHAVSTVDVTATTVREQRSTPWMTFESLADFLDPADNRFTIEGHPAPVRAVLIATT